ncbi:hypothetical protein K466DRAFT_580474 [Polyporus arcularius HHB13444]|uniref:Uncharacterized protein n=1 Tax=Polyporus arcularius HHB13444 TaxID=1314778 RepID=A0A5C3PZ01_9APHY|nr:hypothetical protein K466DRAFT_580474 [Polyporus arcularius HHB13444]
MLGGDYRPRIIMGKMVTVKHDPCRTAHMRPLVVKQRSSSAHAPLRSARGYKRKPRPNIPDKRKPRARMPHPTNREEIVSDRSDAIRLRGDTRCN